MIHNLDVCILPIKQMNLSHMWYWQGNDISEWLFFIICWAYKLCNNWYFHFGCSGSSALMYKDVFRTQSNIQDEAICKISEHLENSWFSDIFRELYNCWIFDKVLNTPLRIYVTSQKMKFSLKDFFSKCDQIHMKLRIWSYLLKKSFMKNFIFCGVRAESVGLIFPEVHLVKVHYSSK